MAVIRTKKKKVYATRIQILLCGQLSRLPVRFVVEVCVFTSICTPYPGTHVFTHTHFNDARAHTRTHTHINMHTLSRHTHIHINMHTVSRQARLLHFAGDADLICWALLAVSFPVLNWPGHLDAYK